MCYLQIFTTKRKVDSSAKSTVLIGEINIHLSELLSSNNLSLVKDFVGMLPLTEGEMQGNFKIILFPTCIAAGLEQV